MKHKRAVTASVLVLTLASSMSPAVAASDNAAGATALGTMKKELHRSMDGLQAKSHLPVYYLAYRLYQGNWYNVTASDGALEGEHPPACWRMLSVDLRIGSPRLDNTHFLKTQNSSPPHIFSKSTDHDSILPGNDAGLPLQQCLWLKTDHAFKEAQRRFAQLGATKDVLAAEEDTSGDFSMEPAHNYQGRIKDISYDTEHWKKCVRDLSLLFRGHPNIYASSVGFTAEPTTRCIVNSEGSEIVEQQQAYRLAITGATFTDDGMIIKLYDSVEAPEVSALPDEAVLAEHARQTVKMLEALHDAPPAEPYVGPAILSGKAAAVFFHETFGHRVESIHEKNENEGKTFAKRIGTLVMPSFISVKDDPTVSQAYGTMLNGHYVFDDDGVPAQPVVLTDHGILKSFLMSRTPVQGFPKSNGHGRSSPGWNPVARQANLFVTADKEKQVSPQDLRSMLIAEAKRQNKEYGLLFQEVAGGSTWTATQSDQTYTIYPLVVYKVFVDGKPDQLIRGTSIVGTPLEALEKIMAAGSDYQVFNGRCGRDSGWVPVSAVAPSLLVQSIEIKRAPKNGFKAPILQDPTVEAEAKDASK